MNHRSPSRCPLARVAWVAAFFLLAACLGLYMLLLDPARNVGATLPTDYYHFNWNYWWMRHALTHGVPIYSTDYVLAPATTNLAYHTLTAFWFPAWALLEPLFGGGLRGTIAAMNALYVLATALTGGLCYALLRREGAPRGWALAGGNRSADSGKRSALLSGLYLDHLSHRDQVGSAGRVRWRHLALKCR